MEVVDIVPQLSIVIPTKGRNAYAENCVQSIISNFGEEKYEIVVFDTNPTDELRTLLTGQDSRVIYIHRPDVSGYVPTFNTAVSHATGKYVTVIGDDDGILPQVMQKVAWAETNGYSSFSTESTIIYRWPGFVDTRYGKNDAATLAMPHFDGSVVAVDLQAEFEHFAASGFVDFSRLPKLYYGVVRQEVIERVYARFGGVFFGTSPDISSSLMLGMNVGEHFIVSEPLFIGGASKNSGAGRTASGSHAGRIEDEAWMSDYVDRWPETIPRVFSPETMWAQSATEVLSIYDRFNIRNRINREALFARTLIFNFKLLPLLRSDRILRKLNPVEVISHSIAFVKFRASNLYQRLTRTGRYNYVLYSREVEDIVSATRLSVDFLNAQRRP